MSKSLDKLRKELRAIQGELQDLDRFRDTSDLRKLIRSYQGKASYIREQISRLTRTEEEKGILKKSRIDLANKNRSEKMKRNWRYLKAIKSNYPVDLSLRDLRTALRKHRQGLETDISDVAWRNPSP